MKINKIFKLLTEELISQKVSAIKHTYPEILVLKFENGWEFNTKASKWSFKDEHSDIINSQIYIKDNKGNLASNIVEEKLSILIGQALESFEVNRYKAYLTFKDKKVLELKREITNDEFEHLKYCDIANWELVTPFNSLISLILAPPFLLCEQYEKTPRPKFRFYKPGEIVFYTAATKSVEDQIKELKEDLKEVDPKSYFISDLQELKEEDIPSFGNYINNSDTCILIVSDKDCTKKDIYDRIL